MIVSEKAQPEAIQEENFKEAPPPPYAVAPTQPETSPDSVQSAPLPAPQAANFISIVRKDKAIKGTFAIDPSLSIPASLLTPLAEGHSEENRDNLKLETQDGSIDVHVWLINDKPVEEPRQADKRDGQIKPTTMNIHTRDGRVVTRIHTSGPTPRPPFYATVRSEDGSVTVEIPRSFNGMLNVSRKDGSIHISRDVKANFIILGDDKRTQRAVIGDIKNLSGSESNSGAWNGDVLVVETLDGSVKIRYNDEVTKQQGIGGILSRVLRK